MITGLIAFTLWPTPETNLVNPLHPAVQSAVVKANKVIRNGYVEVSTTKGSTEKVVLADGSTIIVNSSSKLRYPEKFSGKNRSIYLDEGEAFFKVAEDPTHPFVVHSGDIATTALGTSFNIRAYSREKKITVALLTGKVKVDHAQKTPVILNPSERLSYDRVSLSMAKTTFEKEDDIVGWKHGFLVFKDASYEELVNEIENRYNVTVINECEAKEWNYTGFFKDENLQEIIETICLTKNISYTIKNDTIFLKCKN
nr:FecR family protein [Chitinophaga sp. SYP-B3965]